MVEKDKMIMTFRFFLVVAVAAVGSMAMSAPSVTVGDVKTGEPWSTITVAYTLGGLDADLDYKIAFDVTANGVTRGITNAAAKLTNGTASKAIDTVALFGSETADPKAKVRVSLIAIKPQLGGVQLWENGPYFAECNVGASKPEEYGYYFCWGNTVGYSWSGGTRTDDGHYSDVTWVSRTGTILSTLPSFVPVMNKYYSDLQSQGYTDSQGKLVAKYDAATVCLGAPWRMPTDEEMRALVNKCTTTWTRRNGVYGRLVTGKGAYASKSIFLPAAGYGDGGGSDLYSPDSNGSYWSSTPYLYGSTSSGVLTFSSGNIGVNYSIRDKFCPVRPLRVFAK